MLKKKGRPSSFDREKALHKAMELFWARGFEGTTLEDLQTAMGGITPPSFYNAFGSKEELFRAATDLYVETVGGRSQQALQEAKAAREAIESMLRATAESFSLPGKPHGCLLVLGAVNCTPANQAPQARLRALRQRAPHVIKQRLDRDVAGGGLPRSVDTRAVAAFYATVVHGLAVRAGDGAARSELMASVDAAMAAWPALTRDNASPIA
jgi:AcrR family transcriptional regulator